MFTRFRYLYRAGAGLAAAVLGGWLLWPADSRPSTAFQPEIAAAAGGTTLFLPVIEAAPFDLISSWTADSSGVQLAYPTGGPITHKVSGRTIALSPVTGFMKITETGPCGAGQIFSGPVELPAGGWQRNFPATAPDCPGVYTSMVELEFEMYSETLHSKFVVNDPFVAVLSTDQGFDRCVPPSVSQLAAWWDESPYSVVNIYLGGIHYPLFCQTGIQDAFWVHAVAEQGWDFTAIWVGPQPPCTDFTHRMSANLSTAYQQGRAEADGAAMRARELGLFGDLTIHYDVEGYFGDTACRNVVKSFLQGWTDRLHELDLRAGAYGGACSSSVSDWAQNAPPIDQVWIAHWQLPAAYNPDATVWNAVCVSNSLWPDHQRIKQYAGDHTETWGGAALTIDSNVFDTAVIGPGSSPTGLATARPLVQDFGPLGEHAGWLLTDGSLYATDDTGETWNRIAPESFFALGAAFTGPETGWIVGWAEGDQALQVGRTLDRGLTWSFNPVGVPDAPVADAYFEVLDDTHVWLALKVQSGSSFSLGRLYASADGGATWEMRSHPLGEAVLFESALAGWTHGGPAGVSAYRTLDGGRTWTAVEPAQVPAQLRAAAAVLVGAPPAGTVETVVWNSEVAWALVQEGACSGEKYEQVCRLDEQIRVTADGGLNWNVQIEIPLPGD